MARQGGGQSRTHTSSYPAPRELEPFSACSGSTVESALGGTGSLSPACTACLGVEWPPARTSSGWAAGVGSNDMDGCAQKWQGPEDTDGIGYS